MQKIAVPVLLQQQPRQTSVAIPRAIRITASRKRTSMCNPTCSEFIIDIYIYLFAELETILVHVRSKLQSLLDVVFEVYYSELRSWII